MAVDTIAEDEESTGSEGVAVETIGVKVETIAELEATALDTLQRGCPYPPQPEGWAGGVKTEDDDNPAEETTEEGKGVSGGGVKTDDEEGVSTGGVKMDEEEGVSTGGVKMEEETTGGVKREDDAGGVTIAEETWH